MKFSLIHFQFYDALNRIKKGEHNNKSLINHFIFIHTINFLSSTHQVPLLFIEWIGKDEMWIGAAKTNMSSTSDATKKG